MHTVIEQGLNPSRKTQSKINSMLTDKFTEAGKKERYCLTEFFKYLSFRSNDYNYSFSPSDESECIGFDGTLIISYKMTGTILSYYIVEAKVRTEVYDAFIFEKYKLNTLKKYKQKLDKYFNAQYSDKTINMMFVSFTEKGTFMYDILTIIKNNLMPKITKDLKMNKATVTSREDKIQKDVYLLPQDISVKYKWNFNETEYQLSRIKTAQTEFNKATEVIKTIVSLF